MNCFTPCFCCWCSNCFPGHGHFLSRIWMTFVMTHLVFCVSDFDQCFVANLPRVFLKQAYWLVDFGQRVILRPMPRKAVIFNFLTTWHRNNGLRPRILFFFDFIWFANGIPCPDVSSSRLSVHAISFRAAVWASVQIESTSFSISNRS